MSRIGNKLIPLVEGVTLTIENNYVDVKGKNGEDKISYDPKLLKIEVVDNHVKITRANDLKATKQIHGTTRALLNNAIIGCSKGFTKELEIIGIGYRAELKGKDICLYMGYANPVTISPLAGVSISLKDPTHVSVSGSDKFKVGQTAALIRNVRKPEPYLGKGIKYKGEFILRKEGKRAGKK